MRKTSNGGFAIGAGSGDVDPSWAIPDGDGVSNGEGWEDCRNDPTEP